MTTRAYYNENDPFCAEWLRNLITAGWIIPGDVDERSIVDVQANDVRGYTQCHFFAGIGVWPWALYNADWPDDRPIWTGSAPCQPFSCAGASRGTADERHLWPEWFRLIRECRPPTLIGEQVASPAALAWLDLVQDDLEGAGYAVGATDLCASSCGSPHIRQRLYWVANHCGAGLEVERIEQARRECAPVERSGEADGLAHPTPGGQRIDGCAPGNARHAPQREPACGMGDSADQRCQGRLTRRAEGNDSIRRATVESDRTSTVCGLGHADGSAEAALGGIPEGPLSHATGGFWAGAEWLPCRDGKARPTRPGLFPLAHGIAARVGKLRAAGNSLCAPVAQAFIEAVMDALP